MALSALAPRLLKVQEKLDWLRLFRSENVGPVTFRRLLERYGSAGAALARLPDLAKAGGRGKPIRVPAEADIAREVALTEQAGARLVAAVEPDYPRLLAEIEDAPPLITMRGNAHILGRDCIAIVGARNASLNGRKLAEQLARDLGAQGFTIISGLARGIDTAAHQGSLVSGTAAVLAGGIDQIYPPENAALYEAVVAQGCLIAEQPVGSAPMARDFPRRNRIISGICRGVIVVEAAMQSGSLITARMALDQGREVFAVPGSPLDPRSQGCNDLLRQGAALVERASDVLNALSRLPPVTLAEPGRGMFDDLPAVEISEQVLAAARKTVCQNLSATPVTQDELLRATGLAPPVLLTVLLELELALRIERQPGNRICLIEEGFAAIG